jgi:hypothetical protein
VKFLRKNLFISLERVVVLAVTTFRLTRIPAYARGTAVTNGRTNWLVLGTVGLIVVNLINISVAMLYGIIESGYTNIVLLISMLLTSTVLAITWSLYNRTKSRGRIFPPSDDSFEALDRDQRAFIDPTGQENGTIILPFDAPEEEGLDVVGYGHVPYSTKTRTGTIRCKRCLLINEASREGQTCKHCGTYLLLKH